MSEIDGKFFAEMVRRWHRLELAADDAESLAKILAPFDDTAQELAANVNFDAEPSDYERVVATLAERARS